MKDSIDWLRQNIDRVDNELLKLFEERMGYCAQVGEYKKERDLPVYDAKRELDILEDKVHSVKDPAMRLMAIEYFTEIMDISKDLQMEIIGVRPPEYKGEAGKICYCGAPGAYAHDAAISYFGDQQMMNVESFADVVKAVVSETCEYGVLPIENSSHGSVLEVYDLIGNYEVFIVGEKYIPIKHCLLGTGTLDEVDTVISHPQALSQCEKYITEHNYKVVQRPNTAMAAKEVAAQGSGNIAAIASEKAAEIYGLNILSDNINDNSRNYTRFIIIGKKQEHINDYEKVSLTFSLPHKEGALLDILKKFEHLNLTKIESRPKGKWEYIFYLDFEGGQIGGIIEEITGCKILGTYLKGSKK